MNRNEIVQQYKSVKKFHTIFKGLDFFISLFFKVVLFPFYVVAWMLGHFYVSILFLDMFFVFFSFLIFSNYVIAFALTFVAFCFFIWVSNESEKDDNAIDKADDKLREISYKIFDILDEHTHFHFFTDLFAKKIINEKYEKRWNMTDEQIENYISHREQLGDKDSILQILPFVSRFIQLNKGAKEEQEVFLSGVLEEDEMELVFDKDFSDSQLEEAYRYWMRKDLVEKKFLMNLLFQLAVEQDGIHNDEWNLLMQMMSQFRFNVSYFYYFKNRYSSLRTEFSDYKWKNTKSIGEYSADSLKPYYAVLGLADDASVEEIKQAYHELALQHHPDLPKNASRIEECEDLMMKINEAYERLRR